MVPKGWEVKKFGNLFSVKSGFGFKHAEYTEIGTPLVKIDNVSHGYMKWDNISYLPDSYQETYSDIVLKKNDILLALNRPITRGMLKIVKLSASDVPSILYQRVGRIDFKSKTLDRDFYFYLLNTAVFRFVSRKSIGSDQPFISTTELKKLDIVKPPLPEQQKIAKILSTWDKAISTTERLIENSTQQKKALMQQLLTGKKRLLDESGKRFEGEWKDATVSSFGKVITGNTPPKNDSSNYDGSISWATAEDFKRKYVSNTKVKLTESGATKARIVPKGSVLVTCIASIGKNAIANEDLATNQQINSVVINKKNSNEFFYYLIEFNTHKLLAWAGTTALPILNKTSFEKVKFIVPNLKEQQKIATVLTNADKEIGLLEQQLADLQQEKKALMQQLLTGKKRVVV